MAEMMGRSENEQRVDALNDRVKIATARLESLANHGAESGWVPTCHVTVPTDSDGGGVQFGPRSVLPAWAVPHVPEESRRLVTAAELTAELAELEESTREILANPPEDVDDMVIDQTRFFWKRSRSFTSVTSVLATAAAAVNAPRVVGRQGSRPRASRRVRSLAGSRGSPGRSSDDPHEPGLTSRLWALLRLLVSLLGLRP